MLSVHDVRSGDVESPARNPFGFSIVVIVLGSPQGKAYSCASSLAPG